MAKAGKIIEVTDEMWNICNEFNKNIVEEYLENSTHLSKKSYKQYKSALRIFTYWLKKNCQDKTIINVKSRDYLRFQNWLSNNGLSESTVKLKRSAISNLNNILKGGVCHVHRKPYKR